jgi:bifunctional non-homologous end joining protein LigD
VRERGSRRVKSLVLGAYRDETLVWIGNVGSGLNQETLRQLGSELSTLKSTPIQSIAVVAPGEIEWLRPALVVRAEYSELTHEGRLRHPVFVGFVNKRPEECLSPS